MDTMIVVARTVHFVAAILLFGQLLFALAVATPVWRDARRVALAPTRGLLPLALACGAWVLGASVVSGACWLVAEAALMSGSPVTQVIGDGTIGVVLSSTAFGRLWMWRFGLCLVLGALLLAIGRSSSERLRTRLAVGGALVAAAYLATLAWAGHAAAGLVSGLQVHTVSDVAHLLAAGAWLGALPGFVVLLGRSLPLELSAQVAQRFSTLGVVSVATLFISGVVNTWYLVGDVPALLGTSYGRLLLAKLALFAAMVALAAINRLRLTARLNARDPRNRWALRSLRRNASAETVIGLIVIALVGLLGTMVPAAHQSPTWPFGYTLSWQAAQQSIAVGAVVVVAGIVACVAVGAAAIGVLRHRWRVWTAGIVGLVAVAATWAWLLAVPAYPTTYAWSPVNYTADSIVRGAHLYAQNCVSCHGPYGRGDGPAALSLPIMPADLAAHGSIHRVGELFWWIAHGLAGTPMPAFAPRLKEAEIWDLVQFLRAQSDALAATTLSSHVQPWLSAIVAPDFPFELAGQEQESLRQPQGNSITLLVMYTLPQSLPYLRALVAAASTFGEVGLRVVAIPLSGRALSTAVQPPADGAAIAAITSADAIESYAMFARQDVAANAAAPVQVDYLIDRQGYIRARWIGVPESPSLRTAEVFDQADILRRERQRAPVPAGHTH
jgi:putative copper export protein/mono/diheme cytochrome c family protein